ncbi:hypothetical protein EUX98_g2236 [Antrodiella citrinella]|uniref:Uncharacterized protein n=1 Tax=Antrodiella citrinella TaxID=2447956 RepID=A0A4S4MZJ2_9APHY|nr:hypothetical protein EUX98_g2236 [Antrodiella citrinella]
MKTSSALILIAACFSSVSAHHSGSRHHVVSAPPPTGPVGSPPFGIGPLAHSARSEHENRFGITFDHATLAHPARSEVFARDVVDYLYARSVNLTPAQLGPGAGIGAAPNAASNEINNMMGASMKGPATASANVVGGRVKKVAKSKAHKGKGKRELAELVARALADDHLFARNVLDRASKLADNPTREPPFCVLTRRA